MPFLSPTHLQLCGAPGRLSLKLDGRKVSLGAPRRALPLTDPDRFIHLFNADGQEIGMIRDMADLEPKSRELLEAALAEAYAVTKIVRVLDVEREPLSGQIRWRIEIEPDGTAPEPEPEVIGERRFRLIRGGAAEPPAARLGHQREIFLSGAEDVHTARYPRIFLHDVNGNRYEIENCEALDVASRQAAERYF